MKILIVGDFYSKIYEQAIYDAFLKLGYETYKFGWSQYFHNSIFKKIQEYFKIGPFIKKINEDLLNYCKNINPELVFIYRGVYLFPKTIQELKKTGAVVFGYNNDDPFSERYPKYFWRHFLKSISFYDHIFVYRPKNLDDCKKIGYLKISLLRSYYIQDKNFFIEKLPSDKYVCDVIFAGHYENDGRDEYVKSIFDNGINFKLFGPEWQRSKYYGFFKEKLGEIYPLTDDYNLALNSAKICLVFLSKLNNDTYTRRCFEIIAAKKLMLSEYTDDLNNMFEQGKEAEYFRNKEEMIKKIKYYLNNDEEIKKIARAGYDRLLRNGHEVKDRVKEVLKIFSEFQKR